MCTAGHHGQSVPICMKEVAGSWSHPKSIYYTRVYLPFEGIINLVQVQKYHIEDLLPHGHYLLNQSIHEGCGIHPATGL